MKIYYLDNSGFALILNDTLMVFDCWSFPSREEYKLFTKGYLEESALPGFRRVYLFVSHIHGDHFNKKIFSVAGENAIYVLDTVVPPPPGVRAVNMRPGDIYSDDYLKVLAWPSTDLGVSFQVEAEDKTIFHAGDLNYWHWQEESTKKEIEEAKESYMEALDRIDGHMGKTDVAFFPVDPRMVKNYELGAEEFIRRYKPRIFVPMHFSNKFEVPRAFQERMKGICTVFAPAKRGDLFQME